MSVTEKKKLNVTYTSTGRILVLGDKASTKSYILVLRDIIGHAFTNEAMQEAMTDDLQTPKPSMLHVTSAEYKKAS